MLIAALVAAQIILPTPRPSGPLAPSSPGSDLSYYQSLPLITDNPWNSVAANGAILNGWFTTDNDPAVTDPFIFSDATAPNSPPNVVRIPFQGLAAIDATPAKLWTIWTAVTEVYTEYWFKVSANWEAGPGGAGKVHYLWPSASGGNYWSGMFCAGGVGNCAATSTSPLRLGIWIQWTGAPPDNQTYGDITRFANVAADPTFTRDSWQKWAFYTKQETTPGSSRNGIIRFWVNDVLVGDYTNISTPGARFDLFEFAPYKQNPVTTAQFFDIDHVTIRGQP